MYIPFVQLRFYYLLQRIFDIPRPAAAATWLEGSQNPAHFIKSSLKVNVFVTLYNWWLVHLFSTTTETGFSAKFPHIFGVFQTSGKWE